MYKGASRSTVCTPTNEKQRSGVRKLTSRRSCGANIATSLVSLVANLPPLDQHVLDGLRGWEGVCCYAAIITFVQTLEKTK